MKYRILDLRMAKGKKDVIDYIADNLDLPKWWGRNFDALHDCLTSDDLNNLEYPVKLFVFIDEQQGIELEPILKVFQDASQYLNKNSGKFYFEGLMIKDYWQRRNEFLTNLIEENKALLEEEIYKDTLEYLKNNELGLALDLVHSYRESLSEVDRENINKLLNGWDGTEVSY